MLNLGICNVVGEHNNWKQAATQAGLNPNELKCVTWCEVGMYNLENAVAFFKVRSRDQNNYLVKIEQE
jgi:hypothetical protein